MRLLLFVAIFLLSCPVFSQSALGTNNSGIADSAQSACVQNAGRLLDEAFTLMEKNYYRKKFVNWDSLKAAAHSKLNSSINCEDAYEAINWCFREMKEKHSFIMPTLKAMQYANDTVNLKTRISLNSLVGPITAQIIFDSVAYISIPWISTTDENICTLIADSLQRSIAMLDETGVRRWVVDLRNNKGGNCWPMLAGAGPLIGEGVCGYFVRNQEKVSISYQDGKAFQGKTERCRGNIGYKLKLSDPHIAVLIDNSTSSSGEIMALAFKGKDRVRFFGESTAGLTTANASYPLSDKSMLVLSVCQEADRNGKIYGGRIAPDVVEYPTAISDAALHTAVNWLRQQD